jgi:hypothetical protein
MYYAGGGAAGVPIINASLATSSDLGGNSRGCLISDVLTPGKPQLYLTAHTKYYFRWDTGVRTVTGVTPAVADACACSTNPASPAVACSASSVSTCSYTSNNVDRGVFQVVAPNGDQLASLPTTMSGYAGLPGISVNTRVNPGTKLTSQMNYERFCNFYFAAPDLMYVSDAAFNSNSATNWYGAQTDKLNWAPGIHRYKKVSNVWTFSPETQGTSNAAGGIIDGGFAANDLTLGKCGAETYVFWASADFQNAANVNTHTSLGSRLRYYKPSNGDITTTAASATVYGLDQTNINSVMWRGIQQVPRSALLSAPGNTTLLSALRLAHASSSHSLPQVGAVHGHVQHVPRPQDQHQGHVRLLRELRCRLVVCGRCCRRSGRGWRCRAAAVMRATNQALVKSEDWRRDLSRQERKNGGRNDSSRRAARVACCAHRRYRLRDSDARPTCRGRRCHLLAAILA